jgi:hypothetical protein
VLVESNAGAPATTNMTIPVLGPVTVGTTSVLSTTLQPASPFEVGTQVLHEWAPTPAQFAIDLTAKRLPRFANRGAYEVTAHAITWEETVAVSEPDVARAQLDVFRDAIPEGTAWSWRVFSPRTGTTITLPTLPDDGFDFNVQAGDSFHVEELATARLPGVELAAIRRNPFVPFHRFIAGATGSLVEQSLTAGEPNEQRGKRTARRR